GRDTGVRAVCRIVPCASAGCVVSRGGEGRGPGTIRANRHGQEVIPMDRCNALKGLLVALAAGAGCYSSSVEIDDADGDADADDGGGGAIGDPCGGDGECASGVCNENWGICVAPSCVGEDDFTPCETVTTPDRSYDICVGGSCVSPGCGDATCNPPGPNWTLPDTNQRTCYNNTTAMTCAGTAGGASCETTDFCGQDAQYGWDVTHAATERFTRTVPAATQPVVSDNVTGLQWQGCPAGMTGDASSCSGTAALPVWTDALVYCDGLDWGGFDDWRLPDRYELQSIVDYGVASGPRINVAAFPGTPAAWFWSSSSYAGSASFAWYVYFYFGNVYGDDKSYAYYVRCVRRGPFWADVPVPRFTRTEPTANQFVVADAVTGLVWQGCAAGNPGTSCSESPAIRTWQAALDYCEDLNWAGRTDWYLPDVDELASIVDDHRTNPSIDPVAFPDTPANYFWSSSSYSGSSSYAWYVNFSYGYVYDHDKTYSNNVVRCIRRGP
ncbi:MAG: DUF1566 domain-containing protein, partial [Myxococcota bacterium]|nr:DUF1566 domain-containing protein [Myxococcota bacterium]